MKGNSQNMSPTPPVTAKGPAQPRGANALPPPPLETICAALKINTLTIDWLAGDGSDRCYYRISSSDLKNTQVLMQLSGSDAEALKKGGYDWIRIAEILDHYRIPVPRVAAQLPDHAALIIEDYGDRMLEGQVFGYAALKDWDPVFKLYQGCMEILSRFLAIPQNPESVWCQRQFDEERFVWELNFFMHKYGVPVAGFELSAQEEGLLQKDIAALSAFLAARSRFFVHRDFHSRNVMVHEGKLALLDFQDARLGPPSYDLVSLCFDSYVPFSASQRIRLLENALAVFERDHGKSLTTLVREEWKPMLLQRQLKAIGSFGFLTLDKNRGDYLKYVVPAVATLVDQDVGDDRWPFLSRTLLQRLREKVQQNF